MAYASSVSDAVFITLDILFPFSSLSARFLSGSVVSGLSYEIIKSSVNPSRSDRVPSITSNFFFRSS